MRGTGTKGLGKVGGRNWNHTLRVPQCQPGSPAPIATQLYDSGPITLPLSSWLVPPQCAPRAKLRSKHFVCRPIYSSQRPSEIGIAVIRVLQVRKLRHSEVKSLAEDHTAGHHCPRLESFIIYYLT